VQDVEWLFGYGSVIYRPSFPFVERRPATLRGFARAFSQASDDHRGTAELPGRVVTLRAHGPSAVRGIAYRFARHEADAVFADLDVREQAGYGPCRVTIELAGRSAEERVPASIESIAAIESVAAVAYIAPPGNAWDVGPEPIEATVERILVARGPSGANVEYLLKLADALRDLGDDDAHVAELARRVRTRLAATGVSEARSAR
jgi:cation transport regulator ChaC